MVRLSLSIITQVRPGNRDWLCKYLQGNRRRPPKLQVKALELLLGPKYRGGIVLAARPPFASGQAAVGEGFGDILSQSGYSG